MCFDKLIAQVISMQGNPFTQTGKEEIPDQLLQPVPECQLLSWLAGRLSPLFVSSFVADNRG